MIEFNNAKEMLEKLYEGVDLYNPVLETYLFSYSENNDSIAYYSLTDQHIEEIVRLKKENPKEEYWSAFLGPRGYIIDGYDECLDYCKSLYNDKNWYLCDEYEKTLKTGEMENGIR